jgi:hypothetical protein
MFSAVLPCDNVRIGVRYDESPLADEEIPKAIWLDHRVDDPVALKKGILNSGRRSAVGPVP